MLNNAKPYFKLLKIAFIFNAYKELLQAYKNDSNAKTLHIKKAIRILTDECFINYEKAVWAVGWLASVIYTSEWLTFVNEFNKRTNQQNLTNDDYIKLKSENKKLKQENDNLKKQLEERSNNNQSDESVIAVTSERDTAIQTNSSIVNKIWTLEDISLEMVSCPAGSFMMGSPFKIGSPDYELGRNKDEIQHKVIISKLFMIGKYPITQYQYGSVVGENPSQFKGDNNPVEMVSWNDAKEFCNILNSSFKNKLPQGFIFDLPTEAQWEYACRAGTITSLNSGKNITSETDSCYNLNEVGWYYKNSGGKTHSVGKKMPNDWGIYDMHGNVMEWCKDWYGDYPSFSVTDPTGPDRGSFRVRRGGGWLNRARNSRSAIRSNDFPDNRSDNLGFRLALVPVVQ